MDTMSATRAGNRVKRWGQSGDRKSANRFQSRAIATAGSNAAWRNDSRIQMVLDSSKDTPIGGVLTSAGSQDGLVSQNIGD
jgi:hypothetical protein